MEYRGYLQDFRTNTYPIINKTQILGTTKCIHKNLHTLVCMLIKSANCGGVNGLKITKISARIAYNKTSLNHKLKTKPVLL